VFTVKSSAKTDAVTTRVYRAVARTTATVAVALLAACGGTANDQSGNSALKVALMTPGPISDKAWNGGAYDGLLAIRDSFGAAISHIQTRTPAEFEENFRQYGAQGYRIVIGHGFEFQDAAMRVAPSYPNTIFVCTSGNSTAPNVAGMNFAFEEASYQAGMIAAHLSKSGVIGAIGGTELPPVRASFLAFERGAKLVNPNITVLVSYLGTWEDVSAAKEQALAQIARGADILFQNSDAAGLGIFAAARERNVLAFGANANQNDIAPDHIIGSVVIDLPRALLTVANDVVNGTFTGKVYQLGVRANVVRLELNPKLANRIAPAMMARVDSVGVAIRDGAFREMDDVLTPADSADDTPDTP
jgi:basic membrane lipoprotein Med (substrate-binding protein (PBP1-ABC) superfamily)